MALLTNALSGLGISALPTINMNDDIGNVVIN
jgi:hypothetical protein